MLIHLYYFSSKTKTVQKMSEMGRYMDVSIRPARKVSKESFVLSVFLVLIQWPLLPCNMLIVLCWQMCLQDGTLSKEEAEDGPLDRTVRVIRVDGFCSSDTSCESSPVSSDLEVGRNDSLWHFLAKWR